MRMLCNSTFLFDKKTNHSPKLEEFREIIRELAIEEGRKVVVFSEYERMTHLAGKELEKLGIGFVSLHGGVPSRKRGALMEKFRRDAECRVFLSTDAGGVGLNLQAASAVINFEPPWNPARLEQRIGRVHRLGQAASGSCGAPAHPGEHRRTRVGDPPAQEVPVRGRLRFANRRSELRGARTKERPAGGEGNLRGSTWPAQTDRGSGTAKTHPHPDCPGAGGRS